MNSGTKIPRFPRNLEDHLNENDPLETKDFKKTWDLLQTVTGDDSHYDVESALSRLQTALAEKEEIGISNSRYAKDRKPRSLRHKRTFARRSALFASVAAAVLLFLYWPQTVQAPLGQQISHSLPDGSTIELNSGSSIRYARFFRKVPLSHTVYLEGEAFFDVTKENGIFEVQTKNANVQVLGTAFNVRAWSSEPQTTVVVQEGSVRVQKTQSGEEVILEPEEMVKVGIESLKKDATSSDLSLSWMQGGIYMANEPFPGVMNEIARRFNKRIKVDGSVNVEKLVTLHYSNVDEIESILEDLCVEHNLKYRPVSGGYEIFR